MRPSFSLGIEEEYQTVDPVTRDLRSHIETEMLAIGKLRLQERVKAEMHTSVVEVGTRVCRNIDEAREDIYELRREMIKLARDHNLQLVAGATHPFADWRTQEIYPDPRYHQVVKDLQLVARANLIFGLHVHVGIEDREAAIRIMNSMRYFLPHIMALATNSPFWLGLNTGYKGYRAKVFENFPRTGIPDAFSSYSEFENYVSLLVRTNCIDNAKKIWWDIRPHPSSTPSKSAPATSLSAPKKPSPSPLSSRPPQLISTAPRVQSGLPPIRASSVNGKQIPRRPLRPRWQRSSTSASNRKSLSAISSRNISSSSIPSSTNSAPAKPSTASAKSSRPAQAPTASSESSKNPTTTSRP
jgi:YbdK family carboxylate-amine ligase